MPNKAPHPCAVAGCPNLVYQGGRCEQHSTPKDRTHEAVRPSASARGYGCAWQQKRARWLAFHPWCVDLYGRHQGRHIRAKIVDHIIPLKQGGRDDETNYQSLCVACNNRKTAHDGSRRGGQKVQDWEGKTDVGSHVHSPAKLTRGGSRTR